MRRTLGATTVAGGVLTAALAMGWLGMIFVLAVILVPTLALCWVIADNSRPHRLALLLATWRYGTSTSTPHLTHDGEGATDPRFTR